MKTPVSVTFRHMAPSPAMEARIRDKAARLERFCNEIISCRVAVEAAHRHGHHGHLYHLRIDLQVPGEEIVVSRDPPRPSHEDAYVALRDAFDAARRQLEDYMRRRHAAVKAHSLPPVPR